MGCSLMLTIGTSNNDGNNVDAVVPLAHVAILHGLVWLLVGSMYVAFAKQLHEISENIFFRKLNARFICFVSSRFVF
jgi:hypothetical protein